MPDVTRCKFRCSNCNAGRHRECYRQTECHPPADQIHPHIRATGKPDSSTHFLCSQGPSDLSTHHLIPTGPVNGRVQRCKYCGKPDAQIRQENGLA